MRDLTNIELQTVSGAVRAPAPALRVPASIFGVRLNRRTRLFLAALFSPPAMK
jgi:hypothetical protein